MFLKQLDNLFGLGPLPKRCGNDGQPGQGEEESKGEERRKGGSQMERKGGGGGGAEWREKGGKGEERRWVGDWNLRI